jgi:cyclopropane fatty-acyl-phospholipid synthase-like methyltransferase
MAIRLVQRVDFLKHAVTGKSVLHLGCANSPFTRDSIQKGMLLHLELKDLASEIVGFDFDEEAIQILGEHGLESLYRADLEALDDVNLERTFDVIIAGEMIEHLNNPGRFLKGIQRFMSRETRLIITTVNAYCGMRFFAYALRGRGGMSEPVHPDHVSYYSYSTLNLLVKRHGFEVEEFLFYDLGVEHRPHNRRVLNLLNDVAVKVAPQLADGIIAVCRLART